MKRKKISRIDYENLLKMHDVFPIENWNSFKFIHGGSEVEKDLNDKLKDELHHNPSTKRPKGLYAYKNHDGGFLYIGKGKPLFNRLKSHYRESLIQKQEPKRAKRWYNFFSKYTGELTIYWIEVEDEGTRKILETALHARYNPSFNTFEKKS